ncbi:MAG: N-acetylmuramoyl-L-alanine amidase [Defluviitaleaceae bacterium]|nr:N-acetylmuramoyl-L-alanine amidase [Defluviitaleaceae bacterium]
MKMAVFAGHGGADSGAVSGKLKEKNFTLQISNAVSEILRSLGYSVVNNRTTDTMRSITLDAKLANESGAKALVEIHLDSNDGTPETGSEAYVSIRDAKSGSHASKLAQAMLVRLEKLGFRNRGIFTSVSEEGYDTFGILRLTEMPAVLLEVAFINNPSDMARMDIKSVAKAIAEGIRDYNM